MCNIFDVADAADVIVNGYALSGSAKFFVKKDGETIIENS